MDSVTLVGANHDTFLRGATVLIVAGGKRRPPAYPSAWFHAAPLLPAQAVKDTAYLPTPKTFRVSYMATKNCIRCSLAPDNPDFPTGLSTA